MEGMREWEGRGPDDYHLCDDCLIDLGRRPLPLPPDDGLGYAELALACVVDALAQFDNDGSCAEWLRSDQATLFAMVVIDGEAWKAAIEKRLG